MNVMIWFHSHSKCFIFFLFFFFFGKYWMWAPAKLLLRTQRNTFVSYSHWNSDNSFKRVIFSLAGWITWKKSQKLFDMKILGKRHLCVMLHAIENVNAGNHFFRILLAKKNFPKEKNEFIQWIIFMSRLLKCLEKRKSCEMNERTNERNFIHDYYYHCYYFCISSFQYQHYHQMMIANIFKLFCFTFLRLWILKCLNFGPGLHSFSERFIVAQSFLTENRIAL